MTKAKMPEQVDFEQAIGKQIKVVVNSRYNDLLLTGYTDNSFSMLSIGDSEPSKLAKAFHTNQPWVPIFSMEFREADLCNIFPKEIVGPWFGRVYSPASQNEVDIVKAENKELKLLLAKAANFARKTETTNFREFAAELGVDVDRLNLLIN
jgi:hypothetical protein